MKARFYGPHEGIAGAGVLLPSGAADVVRRWAGTVGDTDSVAAEIEAAVADCRVEVRPPGWTDLSGRPVAEGMVTLRVPAEGFPCSLWRAIQFEPLDEPAA